ncbi:hypothetical protein [Prauserella muralis]|uniref:Uncharacterized protein n=1 Tax=Prauserella muralis TaxID=588067 RepID=A0A2V4B1I3_9PSEU|nr:hypothetical protein [Prauserella muralis]PXY27897.1 hypothetical protein BAY60_16200 [Prauserella muralis]TWE22324.1 hypothetical protein FHX69_3561 [Prauserella muralis]
MTEPDEETTSALTRALRRHAAEAPSTAGLAEEVQAVVRRRRRRKALAALAGAVVVAVAVPVAVTAVFGDGRTAPPAGYVVDPTWRWESYAGIQLQVPPDWGYGVQGDQWCVEVPGEPRRVRPGAVGRPGGSTAVGCGSEYPPLDKRENWLTLDRRTEAGVRTFDGGWVEETRDIHGVFVTVFSDDPVLRAAILRSAQPVVGEDRHGCPADHPITTDKAGYRPEPPAQGLPSAGDVESISVCRYALETFGGTRRSTAPILASSVLTGADAARLVAAIATAPPGEGPNSSEIHSVPELAYGEEAIVLRLRTHDRIQEVVVRYSGELGNGIDDGATRRRLTTEVLRPLSTGVHQWSGGFILPVARLLPAGPG